MIENLRGKKLIKCLHFLNIQRPLLENGGKIIYAIPISFLAYVIIFIVTDEC